MLVFGQAGQQVGTGAGLVIVHLERGLATALRVEDEPTIGSVIHDYRIVEMRPVQVVRAVTDTQGLEVDGQRISAGRVTQVISHQPMVAFTRRLCVDIRTSA